MEKSRKAKTERCLIDDCGREALHHGLCAGCYQAAARLVRTGKTTWAKLAEKNLAIEETHKASPLMKAFRKSNEAPLPKARKRTAKA